MATMTPARDYRILLLHVNDIKKKVLKLGVSTLRLPDARMRTNTRHDVYMTWLVIISSTAHDTLRAACSALAFIFTVHYTVHPTFKRSHFHTSVILQTLKRKSGVYALNSSQCP
jgi:hypothetical protein